MKYHETEHGILYHGDCLDILQSLPDNSVNCCITSPPYWGLRDYGTATWIGGDAECEHKYDKSKPVPNEYAVGQRTQQDCHHPYKEQCPKCGAIRQDKQLGLERTPEEYVANMVNLFREVRRVLAKDGTMWLNLGDSYAGSGGPGSQYDNKQGAGHKGAFTKYDNPNRQSGSLKPKDLVGIPWRVAFALQADGWYLRQDIIWHKPNPMPESVTDRCTKSHEYVFLMSKSAKYCYDHKAIQEPANYDGRNKTTNDGSPKYQQMSDPKGNPNTYYAVPIERWQEDAEGNKVRNKRSVWTVTTKPFKEAHFATFPLDLINPMALAGCPKDGVILDPFMGSGTTAICAIKQGKRYIGIDLNPNYLEIAARRIETELDQTVIDL